MTFRPAVLVGVFFLGMATFAVAGSDNAKKLVGVWEAVKSEGTPKGSTIEFTKDGKLKVSIKVGKETVSIDGTYKVNAEKVEVTAKGPDGKSETNTVTIKKLTDKELQIADPKGKLEEFIRVK